MKIINRNILVHSLQIIVMCIAYGLFQALAFRHFVPFSFPQYLLSGILDAVYIYGLAFFMWKVVKYGNFKVLKIRNRFFNYFLLGTLLSVTWCVLSAITLRIIVGAGYHEEVVKVSQTNIILAFLIFQIVLLYFNHLLEKEKNPDLINEEADEMALQETPESPMETEELEKLERIAVKTGQKLEVISVSEIVYFQADGDYVRIFTDSGRFLKEDTIKFYQARLSETEFVRVHRSYLVNVSKILRIELYEKQSQMLSLSNGDKLKISASGYKRLREVLGL